MAFTRADLDEYEVKAMFLINFVKYVDWGADVHGPVRIGIVGPSDIQPALERIAAYKRNGTRPLEIVAYDAAHPVQCHVLFVSHANMSKAAALARELAGRGVLIISEDNSSSSHAAGINLIRTDNKIKFEINQASIRQAGLRLSGQLQQLATVLNP